jgi:hypothetical protein
MKENHMPKQKAALIATASLALIAGCKEAGTPVQMNPVTRSTTLSPADLAHRSLERRAVEAVIWGMPAVNYDLMVQAAKKNNSNYNQITYWSHLPDWKNQTLTPNPDSIYLIPFINTKDSGPMVLEIPPAGSDGSIVGSVDDAWQTAIEDVGVAGVDKGNGGKYLILPPDFKGQPPAGYIPMPSSTYESYALLRSILESGSQSDMEKAVTYGRTIKLYPLSQAAHPPETTFVDVVNNVFDSTIPYDLRFFESLNRIVKLEPWLDRDRAAIDSLKSLGIEKGKHFNPDPATQDALKEGIKEAHAWLEWRYESVFKPPFYDAEQWALPASQELLQAMQTNFANPDSYPVDARGLAYSYAFFSAKHLGTGQYYLMAIKDKNGQLFDGASTYKLTVPANPPVTQYWSATVYDRATHAFIRNMPYSNRGSQTPGLQKNPDGSVDIYFAPKAPAGKDSNWIPTYATGKFEVLCRFYGPTKALFDKTWKLPDIVRQ